MEGASARTEWSAALVGALATLPLAIAYGLIAVSPLGPQWAPFGISASLGSAILFGLLTGTLGSNPLLISGPRAVTALVLAVAIQEALSRGYDAETALALAFCGVVAAGLFQFAAGVLRIGQVVAYVPVPVLAGFVTASALLVILKSLPTALGAPELPLVELLRQGLAPTLPWATLVSGATLLCILGLKGLVRVIPAALIGVAVGSALYYLGIQLLQLPDGPRIGRVELAGLLDTPLLARLFPPWEELERFADIVLLSGLSMGLLTSFDTALSNSAIDMEQGTESRLNRDLRLHGAANAAMGVLGLLPGSGTLNRSRTVIHAGGRTRRATAGTALVLLTLLVALAPLVAAIPLWATAGMMIATAAAAVDRATLRKAWAMVGSKAPYRRVLGADLLVTSTVVFTALAFDLIASVGVGILISALLFILGTGRHPVRRVYSGARVHSKVQRPLKQMAWLEREGRRIAVIEAQGPLFFGTAARVRAEAGRLLESGVQYLVFDFRYVTAIDSTASAILRNLHLKCAEAGGRFLISCVERERRDAARPVPSTTAEPRRRGTPPRWIWLNLSANGVISTLGEEALFDDAGSALAHCEERLLKRFGKSGAAGRRGIIAESAIFDGLSRRQIAALAPFVSRRRFRRDETVFRQGDPGDRALLLVRGQMEVLIDIPGSSRHRRVSLFTEGTLFGEMGLIDGETRSASVIATRPSACLAIDHQGFAALQRTHPEMVTTLLRNLSRQFSARLRLANTMISELER